MAGMNTACPNPELLFRLHTDPHRQFTSAAAVGSHTAVSAWFPLWLPLCAGPAEGRANHTRARGSVPAGDNCTEHENHVLLMNCEIQTVPCLLLCTAEFVGQQVKLQTHNDQCTSSSSIWRSLLCALFYFYTYVLSFKLNVGIY